MTCWVYILRSESTGRLYCGQTEDLDRRLRQHNDATYRPTATTRRFAGHWVLAWSQSLQNRAEAMSVERRIKGRGIKRFLREGASAPSLP